jgi:hypothetical protein
MMREITLDDIESPGTPFRRGSARHPTAASASLRET